MPRKRNERNGELPLPDGWAVAADYDGKIFYIDYNSRQTSWIDPRDRLTKPESFADCIGDELPYGWEQSYDPNIGVYYICHNSKLNQLEDPRQQWRSEQENMLKDYLSHAHDDLVAKQEIVQVKEERLAIAQEEVQTLSYNLDHWKSSRTSLNSTTSVGSKYDPDLLRGDVALAKQRVSRLKRELDQIKSEMMYKERGVETLMQVEEKMRGHQNMYSIEDAREINSTIHTIRQSLILGEKEKAKLMQNLAVLREQVLSERREHGSSPDVSTLHLAHEKLSTASQTDVTGEEGPQDKRWGEVVRVRLQYDEAKRQVSNLQQQLSNIEEQMIPGQTDSDKDRLLLIQEKEQLLRELGSYSPKGRSEEEMSKIQERIAQLKFDLEEAVRTSNKQIAERLKRNETKHEILKKLQEATRMTTYLESQLKNLSLSTLSVSSGSSRGSLGSLSASSKGSLMSNSYTDIYDNRQYTHDVNLPDLHRRVEKLLQGHSSTIAPIYEGQIVEQAIYEDQVQQSDSAMAAAVALSPGNSHNSLYSPPSSPFTAGPPPSYEQHMGAIGGQVYSEGVPQGQVYSEPQQGSQPVYSEPPVYGELQQGVAPVYNENVPHQGAPPVFSGYCQGLDENAQYPDGNQYNYIQYQVSPPQHNELHYTVPSSNNTHKVVPSPQTVQQQQQQQQQSDTSPQNVSSLSLQTCYSATQTTGSSVNVKRADNAECSNPPLSPISESSSGVCNNMSGANTCNVSAAVSNESVAGDSGVFEAATKKSAIIDEELDMSLETAQVQVRLEYDPAREELCIGVAQARNLCALPIPGNSYIFIKAVILPPLANASFRTHKVSEFKSPRFDQVFRVCLAENKLSSKTLQLYVTCVDLAGNEDCLGSAQVSLASFDPTKIHTTWYNVLSFKFMQADTPSNTADNISNSQTNRECVSKLLEESSAKLRKSSLEDRAERNKDLRLRGHSADSPNYYRATHGISSVKEESSDESTIISSQTSTLTRNQGPDCMEGGDEDGTETSSIDEEENVGTFTKLQGEVRSYMHLEATELEDEDDEDTEEEDEEDNQGDQGTIKIVTVDAQTNTMRAAHKKKAGENVGVVRRSQTFTPALSPQAASTWVCKLNRSDSDSSVSFKKGPFQRNASERRSLRVKHGAMSIVHRKSHSTISPADINKVRTSIDLELDLQAHKTRLVQQQEEIDRLKSINARLEKAKVQDEESLRWFVDNEQIQALVTDADKKRVKHEKGAYSKIDEKAEKYMKKVTGEVYKRRHSLQPDVMSFHEKMAFFTTPHIRVPFVPSESDSEAENNIQQIKKRSKPRSKSLKTTSQK